MVRKRITPPEGSVAEYQFRHRPPDPVWAPTALLDRCRRALADYDHALGLWWDPIRRFQTSEIKGRWVIVRWHAHTGSWERAKYWEGADGEYREPSPGPLVDAIGSIDIAAKGLELKRMVSDLDESNKRFAAKDKTAKNEDAWRDAHERASSDRFGPDPQKKISVSVKPGA